MKSSTAWPHIRWDISQGSQEWVCPVDIWMTYGTKISQTTRRTVRCFENILHPCNTIICHMKPIYIWNSATTHESRLSCHTSV